jgi:hypothetical protein
MDHECDVVSGMNADERAERIQQLQGDVDQHRSNIRQREEARAQNPILMHDHLMSTREADAAPQPVAPVQREADPAGLLYRVTETAPVVMSAEDSARWNAWIDGRLQTERAEVFDIIARQMGEGMSEYTHLKLEPIRRELADLRRTLEERDERGRAVAEVRRELQGERVERQALELSAALERRDARIAALEQRVDMLLRHMSLMGVTPPREV